MKIVWSGIGITDGRGKIGGQVASRNSGGAFMRTLVSGTNPNTSYQIAARERYTSAVAYWRTLTPAQQDAWIVAAGTGAWNTTDSLGNPVQPSGFQLFTRVNIAVPAPNFPVVAVPVLPSLTSPGFQFASFELSGGMLSEFVFDLDAASIGANEEVVVWVTAPLGTGIRRPSQSKFKLLKRYDQEQYGTADSKLRPLAEYVARFGQPALGQRIFFSLEIGSTLSGVRLEFVRSYSDVTLEI
jgi:hypothetical protein